MIVKTFVNSYHFPLMKVEVLADILGFKNI